MHKNQSLFFCSHTTMAINAIYIFFITLTILSIESSNTNIIDARKSIRQKHFQTDFIGVVFRHGDRTLQHDETYPSDLYKNHIFYPEGEGALTNKGKKRAYELGVMLRQRFNDFLGPVYLPHNVMSISSSPPRIKMTLQLVLAGLYPPKDEQVWHPILNWQPIPENDPEPKYHMLLIEFECPQYREELQRVLNSREVQDEIEKFHPLMTNLTKWTGRNINSPKDMWFMYALLTIHHYLEFQLPDWSHDIFPHGDLRNGIVFYYNVSNYNTKLRRLYGGVILKHMGEIMHDILENKSKRKINLYSGHEVNVAALLWALGVYKSYVPQYSSAVIVELFHDENNQYYIKIHLYLGIPSKIKILRIPGCEMNCPFEKFTRLLKNVIPTEEDMNCPISNKSSMW